MGATIRNSTVQFGGQGVSGNEELGGPWTCPTPPQYSNGSCDPCGENRPVPYWGACVWVGIKAIVEEELQSALLLYICCQMAPATCHIQLPLSRYLPVLCVK
jgi:hypothetical protein